MHKIEFPDIGIVKEIPSCFDEMTQEDFIRFSHLYLQFQKGSIDYARLKTEMVFQFLGIRHNKWRYELLDDEARSKISVNVFLISGKLDFFFKEEKRDGKVNLKVNFPWTKNLVPAYHGYIGPADALADVSFLEYKNAHVASVEYIKSQDDVDLNWLVAILYRKPLLWFMKKPAYDE
nr:hypothetical protein [Bacteroidota bacterium]